MLKCQWNFFLDQGTEYEIRVAAKNAIDYGEQAVAKITTPDGSKLIKTDVHLLTNSSNAHY